MVVDGKKRGGAKAAGKNQRMGGYSFVAPVDRAMRELVTSWSNFRVSHDRPRLIADKTLRRHLGDK